MSEHSKMKDALDSQSDLIMGIVGGGKACEAFLKMVGKGHLGKIKVTVEGVADTNLDSVGVQYARRTGIPMVTKDFKDLYEIPGLNLLIELTGNTEVFKEIVRTRPKNVRVFDHFGVGLFWQLYEAEESIIQQRTELRERVEEEREWFSQIFNSLPDEIMVLDNDMIVQDANAAFLKNNNLDLKDARGKVCYELDLKHGGCKADQEVCGFFEAMRTKTQGQVLRQYYDKDGKSHTITIVSAPLYDHGNEIVGVIESTRDITHRIQLEEELKTQKGQLKQFLEMAPIATYIKNPSGQYIEANQAMCSLLGRLKSEILGRTDLEICPREAAEVFRMSDRAVLLSGKQIRLDEEVELHGHEYFLSTIKFPMKDAKGNVTAICGLSTDVTDLKKADRELTETRDYLQGVMNNSPLIIMTTDLEGKIVAFNPGAEETLGYTYEEVKGKPASMFYGNPEERASLLRRIATDGSVRDYQTSLYRKDGKAIPVSITIADLKDSEGNTIGTVGMSKDISHRKVLQDQVMQSERLAAVGRLAAGVAHEINNPLAVIGEIAGYLEELIEEDPRLEKEANIKEFQEDLPKIIKHVKRCRSITQRLLSFSRKSEARVEITDVNAALEEIIPFLSKAARLGQVEFHRDYAENLPKVLIEEMQLQEIFINLIHNAIQAIAAEKPSGNIWLTTENREGKVVVTVKDDGPGISPEVRDKIFDPFVSTKPTGQGTGLGLSICYGIIKRYDGQIQVESNPGEGATFRILLPAEASVANNGSAPKP